MLSEINQAQKAKYHGLTHFLPKLMMLIITMGQECERAMRKGQATEG
jgi:hypothetical protein